MPLRCSRRNKRVARRKKKRGSARRGCLVFLLLDGLLTALDFVLGGLADLIVYALRGLARLLGRGALGLVRLLGKALVLLFVPFRKAFAMLTGRGNLAERCLRLSGEEFEQYCAAVLRDNGFREVTLTRASGDQGVDILAVRGERRYAIQCKNYSGAVGNAAVQEAFAGMEFYDCDRAAVLCPGTFTPAARELANRTGVLLWDGRRLSQFIRVSGRRPHHRVQR